MTWVSAASIVMSLAAVGFTIAGAYERRRVRRILERLERQ